MERIDEEWKNLTEDGGIQKRILQSGIGNIPESGNSVEISYKLQLENGEEIEKQEEVLFQIGKGLLIRGWEIAFPTIRKLEKCILKVKPEYAYGSEGSEKLKIPPNSTLVYEIELLNIYDKPSSKEPSLKDKLKNATSLKDYGITYFKQKMYNEAIDKFYQGLQLLYGQGLSNEARELMMSLNLNICNCLNNLGQYETTIERAEFSLKLRKDNPKIYYYRGVAYANLGKIEQADSDYDKLYELLPSNDPGLQNLRIIIDQKKPKAVEKKVFKSFLKAGVSEGREKEQIKRKTSSDEEDNNEQVNNQEDN